MEIETAFRSCQFIFVIVQISNAAALAQFVFLLINKARICTREILLTFYLVFGNGFGFDSLMTIYFSDLPTNRIKIN